MKNTYRACAEINLDALKHNIQEIQAVLGDTKLMCVIKTNAYGHGAVVLARELAAMGAYGFAVATVDEGIELRNNGIIQPILVLGFVAKEQYADMITHHIMPAIFTYSMAKDFDAVASSMHTVADVHIKLDTGMSRIGFKSDEESVDATVQGIVMINSLLKNIRIDGIFTHFACADCENDQMTFEQLKRFDNVIEQLEANGADLIAVHGRTREQMYIPPIDTAAIAAIKQAVSVPVLANGDVTTADEALTLLEATGCDGVMIGRGALGDPWLFAQVRAALLGEERPPEPTLNQRMTALRDQIYEMCEEKGEWAAMPQARSQAMHYMKGLHGAAALRRYCSMLEHFTDVDTLIEAVYKLQ